MLWIMWPNAFYRWGYSKGNLILPIEWIETGVTCLFIIFLFFLLVQWLSKRGIKGLFPTFCSLSHTLFKSHYCSNESVHVVTAGFVWVFAEPAYTWFRPGDVNLAWENEFFLGRQTCLVHSFAVTICAVVEEKKIWECRIVESGGLK